MSLPPPPQPQQYPPQQQQYPPQPQQYYAPPPVAPVGPAPGITYAGFLSRFIAYLIDGFIIGIIEVLLIIVVGGAIGVSAAGDRVNGAGVGIGFLLFLI